MSRKALYPKHQFNVRVNRALYIKANQIRLEFGFTWPALVEAMFENLTDGAKVAVPTKKGKMK